MELISCLVNGAHGQYIPRVFAEIIDRSKLTGVSDEDLEIILGDTDQENYYDAWIDVLDNAVITVAGMEYQLFQKDDLFIYRQPLNDAERKVLNAFFESDVYELDADEED